MGGQIDLVFDQSSNALPYVSGGKIWAYAVAAKRLRMLPSVIGEIWRAIPSHPISQERTGNESKGNRSPSGTFLAPSD